MLMPPLGIAEFGLPVVTVTVVTSVGGVQRICQNSPSRVVLIIANDSTVLATVLPNSSVTTNRGIQTASSLAPLILTWAEHGPLVTSEWWAASGGTSNMTVIEVNYRPTQQEDRKNGGLPLSDDEWEQLIRHGNPDREQ